MAKKRRVKVEPHWEPLARRTLTRVQVASILARNIIPLALVLAFHGSVIQFLLLCQFNIALTIMCIGVVGVAVSTPTLRQDTGAMDHVAGWLALLAIAVVGSLVLTAMFGWVIALIASEEPEGLWSASLGWGVLAIVAGAAPGLYSQYHEDLRSGLGEEQRKQRDQPEVLTQVFCAGMIFLLSGHVAQYGHTGVLFLAFAITALFLFRDLRPDLMRELTRPGNRPPGS